MKRNTLTHAAKWLIWPLLLLATACSTIEHSPRVTLDRQAGWALLPIVNHSDTPQAGLRLENMLESQLRAAGVAKLTRYPVTVGSDLLLDPRETQVQAHALAWAKDQGIRYAITGTVNEWRYKTGVDGEPAVGITLQIINVQDDTVIYSAGGAKTGWSREALAAVAHKLTRELLGKTGL